MFVPTSEITEGNNPRRYFDQEAMEELADSIRSVGIIQPLAVEKTESGYRLIAGGRRLRAAKMAGLMEVPVHVIEEGDTEAIALIENTVRADMSPAEECDAALNLLHKNKGDYKEVSLILGWPESKLRRRVALASCSDAVRGALTERRIKLGVAELLATVPDTKNQDAALEKILNNNLSVDQVRAFLFRIAQKIEAAIFDRAECVGCRFNTEQQATLFSETISEAAYCTNGSCYAKKTEDAVAAKAKSLEGEYSVVRILKTGEAESAVKLMAGGPNGVGSVQAGACRKCANFGATVSCLSGSEGVIEEGICFDLACNEKMAEAYRKEIGQAAAQEAAGESIPARTPIERPKVETRKALLEYRRKIWNTAAARGIAAQPEKGMALAVSLVAIHKKNAFDEADSKRVVERNVGEGAAQQPLGRLAAMVGNHEKMGAMLAACSAFAIKNIDEQNVVSVLEYLQADIGAFWKINDEYLGLLTRGEKVAMAEELGISEKIGNWKKVSGGRKEEIQTAILAANVDFTGLVPANLQYGKGE